MIWFDSGVTGITW